MDSLQPDFPYLPRRSAPLRSRSPSRRAKPVVYDDSDSSDLSSDDQESPVHLQLRLKKPQLRSILKHSQPVHDGSKSGHRYAITVVPYRSSCCGVIVRFEHVSETLANSGKHYNGQCPTCNSWVRLQSDPIDPTDLAHSSTMHRMSSASNTSPSPKSSRRRVQFAEKTMVFDFSSESAPCLAAAAAALAPTSCAPPPRMSFDAIYSLFNSDFGEAYPNSEYSASLGSNTASSEMYETFIRVMSVGGLTVLLYSVLS